MTKHHVGVFALALIAAACGGSDGAAGANGTNGKDGAGGTAGTNGTNGAQGPKGDPGTGSSSGAVPTHAAAGITFEDRDPSLAVTDGTVKIAHAADESDVTSYVVYWGSDTTHKLYLTPLFEVAKSGADITYPLTAAPPPSGAHALLVVSKNAAGEMATGPSVTLGTGGLVTIDIASGQGHNSGTFPAIALDETNQKVLVASCGDVGTAGLFRCNYDGTGCTFTDISVGAGSFSCDSPSIAIDATNGKLYVAAMQNLSPYSAFLYRCNLDGTSCTRHDVSAGRGVGSGNYPTVLVDSANAKVNIVTDDASNNGKVGLSRCDLDGTGCGYADLSAGAGANSGSFPTAVIDTANNQLVVASTNEGNSSNAYLSLCHLDGSACVAVDISEPAGANSGDAPSIALDPIHNRIDVVAYRYTDSAGFLFHCTRDGLNCEQSDPFQGSSGRLPSIAFDKISGKMIVAGNGSLGLNVSRCDSNGLNCTQATADLLTTAQVVMAASGRFWIASSATDTGHPMLTFIQ